MSGFKGQGLVFIMGQFLTPATAPSQGRAYVARRDSSRAIHLAILLLMLSLLAAGAGAGQTTITPTDADTIKPYQDNNYNYKSYHYCPNV